MKKSKLRLIIKEEIEKLNETLSDAQIYKIYKNSIKALYKIKNIYAKEVSTSGALALSMYDVIDEHIVHFEEIIEKYKKK